MLRCTLGFARRQLIGEKLHAGLNLPRFQAQNMGVCAKDGLLPTFLSPQQPFLSSPILGSVVSLGANRAMEKKELLDGRCSVPSGLQSHSLVRQPTEPQFSRGTNPLLSRRGIERRRQTVLTAISSTEDHLRAQSVPTKLARESLVQIRLASLARNCGDECMILPVRELTAFPHVRTSESRGAPHCASVPAGPGASRRIPLTAQPDPVPWSGCSGRADSPCSGLTVRLRHRSLDMGSGCDRKLLPLCTRVSNSAGGTISGHGSFSESLSSPHSPSDPRRSIRGSPLTKSDWLSLRGSCTPSVSSSWFWPLSTIDGGALTSSSLGETSVDSPV